MRPLPFLLLLLLPRSILSLTPHSFSTTTYTPSGKLSQPSFAHTLSSRYGSFAVDYNLRSVSVEYEDKGRAASSSVTPSVIRVTPTIVVCVVGLPSDVKRFVCRVTERVQNALIDYGRECDLEIGLVTSIASDVVNSHTMSSCRCLGVRAMVARGGVNGIDVRRVGEGGDVVGKWRGMGGRVEDVERRDNGEGKGGVRADWVDGEWNVREF